MKALRSAIFDVAIAVLEDDYGVSKDTYDLLRSLLEAHRLHEITDKVDAVDDRYFLCKAVVDGLLVRKAEIIGRRRRKKNGI